MTIIAIAAGAIAAVAAYRRRRAADPAGTEHRMTNIRQSVAVVLAIADAAWAVLDALISLTRPRRSGLPGSSPLRPVGQVASDVGD